MANKKKITDWRLGEIMIQKGWITWEQLEEALEIQRQNMVPQKSVLVDANFVEPKGQQRLNLGEILVRNKWIVWEDLQKALTIQKDSNRILGKVLVEEGFVTQDNLSRALAIQFHMAFVDLKEVSIPKEAIDLIPRRFAVEYKIIPLVAKGGILVVGICDPLDVWPESELRKLLSGDYQIRPALVSPEEIEGALKKYYGP